MSAESANRAAATPRRSTRSPSSTRLPARPGVYRMLDAQGEILYVGKARNLKSRVGSYFQPSNVQPKVQALVAKTASMEVTITNSDTEALLLEFNLIKKHRPRFNVVLRDDKSFPFLHLETASRVSAPQLLPRLAQGARPVLRALPVRRCGARDACSSCRSSSGCATARTSISPTARVPACNTRSSAAPRLASGSSPRSDYARDVEAAIKVLEGRNDEVQSELGRRMETAAERLNFEEAARRARSAGEPARPSRRSKSSRPTSITTPTSSPSRAGNGEYCIALMFVRGGRSLGSTTFFPKAPLAELPEVLAAFVAQYYLERESPPEIIVERDFEEMQVLEATLAERAGHKVRITSSVRGIRARWLEMMRNNAEQALKMRGLARASIESSLEELREALRSRRGRRAASNASTSATPAEPIRWPPAWCSASRGR